MSSPPTTIPVGSWVLITGITGYLATHIALEFLKRGYKVRGTTRDVEKAKWLSEELFPSYSAKGDFEIVQVPEYAFRCPRFAHSAYQTILPLLLFFIISLNW